MVTHQKTYCKQILTRTSGITDAIKVFFVRLDTLLNAISYGFNMAETLGVDLVDRCGVVQLLSHTTSPCRLTRSFALAAMAIGKLADAVTEAASIRQTADNISEKLEPLMEELWAGEPLDGAEEDSLEDVQESIASSQSAIENAAHCCHRFGATSRVGTFLQERVVARMEEWDNIIDGISKSEASAVDRQALAESFASLVRVAHAQFPLVGSLLTMSRKVKGNLEQTAASTTIETLLDRMAHSTPFAHKLEDLELVLRAAEKCEGLTMKPDALQVFASHEGPARADALQYFRFS